MRRTCSRTELTHEAVAEMMVFSSTTGMFAAEVDGEVDGEIDAGIEFEVSV